MDIDMTVKSSRNEAYREPTYEELLELKKWLFKENARIQAEKNEQQRIYDKFIKERTDFMEDMKRLNSKMLQEQKRLKEDNMFFDKKLQILQNGFMQLELDRKKLERERREFEVTKRKRAEKHTASKANETSFRYEGDVGLLFSGVNNPLALRKRYRDLLKIFHPDNACGDEAIVKEINEEYERLKKVLTY